MRRMKAAREEIARGEVVSLDEMRRDLS